MALVPQTPDFTDKDFDALRARLILLVQSVFPDWTDFNVLNFGNILLDLFSFVGGVLTFYQDNQAGEAFIPTAVQRASIIKLGRLIGFELSGQSAATATTRLFLTSGVTPGTVTFPAGTICRTPEVTDAVRFQTLTAAVILAAADPPEVFVEVENSESVQEIIASNDLADQAFLLQFIPFLDDSLDGNITTSQGTWDEVDNFLDSSPTDRHFTVEVDQNDRATVRFGDGTQGLIPTSDITFDYKIGGGAVGNVEVGDIQVVEGTFQDSFANSVQVACSNAAKAAGGGPRINVPTARVQAPQSLRVLNRTVAREDYEINAVKVSGVDRALMLTSDQDPAVDENTGILRIIPTGGGQPSQVLQDAVLANVTVEFPNTITFTTNVSGATFLTVNVDATVFLRQGSNATTVKKAITSALTDFFALTVLDENGDEVANPDVDFGFNFKDVNGDPAGEIAFSDVFNVVRDTVGVRKIGDEFGDFLLNGDARDLPLPIEQFPQLGTVTLIDGDTGLPL